MPFVYVKAAHLRRESTSIHIGWWMPAALKAWRSLALGRWMD